jgi:hypothetical protein
MTTARRLTAVLAALALVVIAPACGDDGAEVRDIGGTASGTGTGTASGSGPASGSGSGTASGSGPASEVAACEDVGDPATAGSQLRLVTDEWSIVPDTPSVPAGSVAISAVNEGEEVHEVLVVRAESIGGLPRDADGALDESQLAPDAVIGELEGIRPGQTCTGVFDLEPGSYALVCNIVEREQDGSIEAHLQMGMATMLTVT